MGNILEINSLKNDIGLMAKTHFFVIPDTRNTRWFWKNIGYGSGIANNYRVGSGIGYPFDTGGDSIKCEFNAEAIPYFQYSILQLKRNKSGGILWSSDENQTVTRLKGILTKKIRRFRLKTMCRGQGKTVCKSVKKGQKKISWQF